jgi:cytochrome c oxidase subunit II
LIVLKPNNVFRETSSRFFGSPSKRGAAKKLLAGFLVAFLLTGCREVTDFAGIPNALDARGPAAADITVLWWIMFWLGTAVFLLVTGLSLYIVINRRQATPNPELRSVDSNAVEDHSWIWYGGVIMPSIILVIVLFFTLRSLAATAKPPVLSDIEVEIVGWTWFWEVRYPHENFATANEMYIPVGTPVLLRLTSADVIHSFWVPQLHGKMDLIPGRTNTFWIQADEPGIYRGICAEFCGAQHARMQFMVVAVSEEEYIEWANRQSQPAADPQNELVARGRAVFETNDCAFCHTVRGTQANGQLGPDLTHVGSRLTLGAGTLVNNRGNLAGWIVDPQHAKPGNLMPRTNLPSEDLQALLAFMESLE